MDIPEKMTPLQLAQFAQGNMALANSNWDNILPWRFLKWRRIHKQVRRNLAFIERELERHEELRAKGIFEDSGYLA